MIKDPVALPPVQFQIFGQFDENDPNTYNQDMKPIFAKKGSNINLIPDQQLASTLTPSWAFYGYEYNIGLNDRLKFVIDLENASTNPSNTAYVVIDFVNQSNTQINKFSSVKLSPGQRQKFIISIQNNIGSRIRYNSSSHWTTYVDNTEFLLNGIRIYIHSRNVNNATNPVFPKLHHYSACVLQTSLRAPLSELTGVCLNQKLLLDSFLQSKWKPQGTSFPGTSIRVTKGIGVIKNMMFEILQEATMNMMQPKHFHEYLLTGVQPPVPGPNEVIYVVARFDPFTYSDNKQQGVAIAFCRPETYDKIDNPEEEGWLLLNVILLNGQGQIASDEQIIEKHTFNNRINYRPTIPPKITSELNGGVVNPGGSWEETWLED